MAANNNNNSTSILAAPQERLHALPLSDSQWQKAIEDLRRGNDYLDPAQRLNWLKACRHWITQQTRFSPALINELVWFCTYTCDWHLLVTLAEKVELVSFEHLQELACAHWKLGNWTTAYHLLERLMFRHPHKTHCYQLYNQLIQDAHQQGFARYQVASEESELSLEPLSVHHGPEFLWQYHDPQIAELCCLPYLDNLHDWQYWLSDQELYQDQTNFALYHNQWGFIGVVSLVIHDDVGFFYYWIGSNFQGQGLGTRAVKLLMSMAQQCFGLRVCYAKVFAHNLPSRRAMEKAGFERLPFNTLDTDQCEYLYCYGQPAQHQDPRREIFELFKKMQSTTEIEVPLSWKLAKSKG